MSKNWMGEMTLAWLERKPGSGLLWWDTDERGITRVVDVQQIAVEVQVLVTAHLDGGVGRLVGRGAWWEVKLGEDGEGRQGHFGDALGAELGLVDDDLLDIGVGGLNPVWRERGHCCLCSQ